jgi:hypothetical protein
MRLALNSTRLFVGALALASSALGRSPLLAQSASAGAPSGRGSFGFHAQLSEPKGDFARNTDNGFGLGGYALIRADRNAILNFRADVSFLNYASSTRRIPLANTGGLIQLDLRTTSNIVSVLAGPQLLGPTGTITPYASALGGFSVFWTTSAVEGSNNDNEPFASTTNSSDAVWAYGGAAGLYIRVKEGRVPVRLDLGARFLRHDDVRYLNDQRVRDAFPVRGRADFLTYYVGANIIAW